MESKLRTCNLFFFSMNETYPQILVLPLTSVVLIGFIHIDIYMYFDTLTIRKGNVQKQTLPSANLQHIWFNSFIVIIAESSWCHRSIILKMIYLSTNHIARVLLQNREHVQYRNTCPYKDYQFSSRNVKCLFLTSRKTRHFTQGAKTSSCLLNIPI